MVDSNSIQVMSRSFTSVTVQWTKPQDNYGEIRYYQFQLGECETSPCQPISTYQYQSSANSHYYTLENLSPFATYRLEMAAYSGAGLGPYSNAVIVHTVQPGQPYCLMLALSLSKSSGTQLLYVVMCSYQYDLRNIQYSNYYVDIRV